MPHLSAVVIAGDPGFGKRETGQATAMISALGRPLIDYALDALRGCHEVSEVVVSVTGSTPLTESHVQSRGYQSTCAPESGNDSGIHHAMRLLSTPYVMAIPANLPLVRSEAIDEIVEAFYSSKKSSMIVGIPVTDILDVIAEPTTVIDMDGVRAKSCGVVIMDRELALNRSGEEQAYLVTDLEDFAIDVNTIGDLKVAEAILRSRRSRSNMATDDA